MTLGGQHHCAEANDLAYFLYLPLYITSMIAHKMFAFMDCATRWAHAGTAMEYRMRFLAFY
jgi:hypothetical protein